jgi:hypothetical protein
VTLIFQRLQYAAVWLDGNSEETGEITLKRSRKSLPTLLYRFLNNSMLLKVTLLLKGWEFDLVESQESQ